MATVGENDPALVISTTGSTGAPKPAMLSHRNITCQNMCLGAAFGFGDRTRLLVNLPLVAHRRSGGSPHDNAVLGRKAVMLEAFDAARSLRTVERYGVNLLGQVPTMFQLEWRLADYGSYNLGSLEGAFHGGQQVARPFLQRLEEMAPRIGTGLGLTESAGFCTYTTPGAAAEDLAT
jgi:acyl-CoA synthetase (AMP-forming)/AMP-acid ligase II